MSQASFIKFYNWDDMSRERGDIPIFSNASKELDVFSDSVAARPVITQHTGVVNIRQSPDGMIVQIPFESRAKFLLFQKCNVAAMRITTNVTPNLPNTYAYKWYWITDWREITQATYDDGVYAFEHIYNIEMTLEYLPITTGMNLTSTISIIPERLPTVTANVIQNWTQSIMKKTTPAVSIPTIPNKLPKIKNQGYETPLAWVSVYYSSSTLFSDINGAGFFVGLNNQSPSSRIRANTGQYDYYPSLSQLFDDNLLTMLTSQSNVEIIGINISEFCPFEYTVGTYDASNQYILINDNAGNPAGQSNNDYLGDHYKSYAMPPGVSNFTPAAYTTDKKAKTGTITLTPSNFEIANGQYVILDSYRNRVATIPRELMSSSMSIDYMTFSVLEGTYTILKMGNWMITLKSTVFPWTTSSWVEYRNFNMQYDRQALQNSIDFTNKELENSLIDGAATGIIGGSLAGAMTGGGIGAGLGAFTGISSFASAGISGMIKRDMTIEKLRREQELTEQRMRNGPITLNNFASGLSFYEMVTLLGGAEIILEMPAGLTETEWTAQTGLWGYPSNKVLQSSVALQEGYYKGRVTAITGPQNDSGKGVYLEKIINEFDNGVRLKKVA